MQAHGGRLYEDGSAVLAWDSKQKTTASLEPRGCRKDTPLIQRAEATKVFAEVAPSWQVGESTMGTRAGSDVARREIRTRSHAEAMKVMNGVAGIADRENHHPNLELTGTSCDEFCVVIETSSAAAGGLTEYDVRLARAIDGMEAVKILDQQ